MAGAEAGAEAEAGGEAGGHCLTAPLPTGGGGGTIHSQLSTHERTGTVSRRGSEECSERAEAYISQLSSIFM